ncbi:Ribosomal protein L28e [Kalmanozyma brasiliensis GHG001]|uniref:Ribosomal eL28/Mak16 domain-containing protein n=1 Tax=Kalmanozyma brasiliensis (strain GHG001) TaxID=1365824 RepID=V5EZ33_KALBG|nr:Ribosomal protein L28e [Kalmanozyma brasiliensis GHG001]EST09118.1 Ribosomal protein L28e [Kalmanozyma brasiliensis GHG001]
MASQDLQWLLVRNNSSFIVKQKGLGRIFSREPRNLVQLHSYKYSGVVNAKAVGISPSKNGKGLEITTKNGKQGTNAIKAVLNTATIKKGGGRRASGLVSNVVAKRGYRSDLTRAAVVRGSAILRSQRGRREAPVRKARGTGSRKVAQVEKTDEPVVA